MKYLRLFRLTLAELFALVTFVALSCVALLDASDRTAWIVGGLFWLAILVSIAVVVTPRSERRPFCLGFLLASLLHLVLMQYTGRHGQTNYDLDLPTFYLIEATWKAIPDDHWPPPAPQALVRTRRGLVYVQQPGLSPRDAAHANFQGIATQLFSIFYGALTGFLAQCLARGRDPTLPISKDAMGSGGSGV